MKMWSDKTYREKRQCGFGCSEKPRRGDKENVEGDKNDERLFKRREYEMRTEGEPRKAEQ